MFENCAVLHFCSVDLVDYPVRGAHRRAIELAKQAGAFVSFDPNVRLPLWSSPADCQAAIRQFLPCADLVKLSDDEIEFVTGCADERAAAEKLFALGVRMVVVTRGANGSAAYTPSAMPEARSDLCARHGHDRRRRLVHRLVPLSADARRRFRRRACLAFRADARRIPALFRTLRLAHRSAQGRCHADAGGPLRGLSRLNAASRSVFLLNGM